MKRYDICIIGGSISGLTAALYSTLMDRRVVLIEKKKNIGIPVNCGEVVPSYLFEQFKELPLGQQGLANAVDRLRITIEKSYEIKLKKYKAFVLNRDRLEQGIAESAESHGCRIIKHCRFESAESNGEIRSINTSSGKIQAKIFIDGSGFASVLGKRLGLVNRITSRNDVGVCSQHEIKLKDVEDIVHVRYPGELNGQGYVWEFAKSEDTMNFGVGIVLSSGLNPTKQLLDKLLKKKYVKCKILKTIHAPIPIEHPVPFVNKFNVMLIGDSGRLVNSFTGGGINNAVYSGHYAAVVADKYLNGEIDNLDMYSSHIRRYLYPNLKRGYKMKEAMIKDIRFLKKFQRRISTVKFFHKFAPVYTEKYGIGRLHGGHM